MRLIVYFRTRSEKKRSDMEETMRDDSCIFCKIANGEIPSKTLYEDERFRVILDLGPMAKGHALLLPKEHFADLYELPDDWAADAMKLAKRMAVRLRGSLRADGLNIMQNNGAAAGQTIFHFHIHLIPRYQNDGHTMGWAAGEASDEELTAVQKQVVGA